MQTLNLLSFILVVSEVTSVTYNTYNYIVRNEQTTTLIEFINNDLGQGRCASAGAVSHSEFFRMMHLKR